MRFQYEMSCIEADGDAINKMKEDAEKVSYRNFLSHCEGVIDWALSKGYDRNKRQGLTLKDDWHVGYYRSTYQGRPCYFLCWSGIEFIWTQLSKTDRER